MNAPWRRVPKFNTWRLCFEGDGHFPFAWTCVFHIFGCIFEFECLTWNMFISNNEKLC